LALAYLQNGQTNKSLKLLEKANKINPYNPDVLFALTTINRDRGEIESALKNAQKLYEIGPENNVYQQLLEQIKAMENNNR
jgi:tetratricopeptide (TPR) repeat protein